jgi:integrase
MPKKVKELSALEVGRLTHPGFHAVGGVPGLLMQVTQTGSRSWVLRKMIGGKRRDMGLGGYPARTLAQARQDARDAESKIKAGVDPIEAARAGKKSLEAARAKAVTFKEAATTYIDAQEHGWRNAKHAQQWRNTLETYAYPVIGSLYVADIDLAHVLKILEPIWTTKTETAHRVRGRIEAVLDWAKGRKLRTGDNPAAWKGNLDAQLASPEKVTKTQHHRAVDVDAVAGFLSALRGQEGMGARALEFAILTAARSGEVRGATWAEVDLEAKVWTVPGDRMKAGKEHRVPLSPAAVKLLEGLPLIEGSLYVFAAARGGMLSDMTLSAVMRRMEVDAVPHGFRSTFRDWAAERTAYPAEMAEMALAHTISDKVEAAYRRGDLFDKRRRMMDDWARFLAKPASTGGKVVPMRAA